jgi:sensor histidine kinase YesM
MQGVFILYINALYLFPGYLLIFGAIPDLVIYLGLAILVAWLLIEFFIWRVKVLARRKKEIAEMQLDYARLEDRALRAQMNPHFIFNSLNSIRLLVQENENNKAIHYLTTFTKLLRVLLQTSEKNTVSLHDELETCRLYLELESLRFNDGFHYSIQKQEGLDLKLVEVPALVLQPFIENAIWHGLMPKTGERLLQISLAADEDWVTCLIDDNGIGRRAAAENRGTVGQQHVSKGLQLISERLKLNDRLNNTETMLEIKDKIGAEGESLGTLVAVKFALNY